MKFNFPENTKREKFINIGFTSSTYDKIKAIAEKRKITVLDVIRTFVDASLEEYADQNPFDNFVLPKQEENFKHLVETTTQKVEEASAVPDIVFRKEKSWEGQNDEYSYDLAGGAKAETADNEVYAICPNPNCHRKTGKFVIGTGATRNDIEYCSIRCADIMAPKVEAFPLPNAEPEKKQRNNKRSDFNAAGSYASVHDNLKIDYQYCQNPACISNGKFVKGTGFQVEDLIFCKRACYDKWRQ